MDVPYAQLVPDSEIANPYAEAPQDAPYPVQNLVRVEGETVICRQDFDVRRFCFISGIEHSPVATELPFRSAPVMPNWFLSVHYVLLAVFTALVVLLTFFVDIRLAGIVALVRFFEIPAVFFLRWLTNTIPPKLRMRAASSAGVGARVRNLGWRGLLVLLTIPAAFASANLAFCFFTGRNVMPVGFHAQSIAYCLLILLASVAEYALPILVVRRCPDSALYRIDGLSGALVAALRSHLAAKRSSE